MREQPLNAEYQDAQENLAERKRRFETAEQAYLDRESKTPIFDAIDYKVQKLLTERAEKRLAKLKIEGGAEAMVTELNKEYERLRGNMEQSIWALKDFERSKLGLTDDDAMKV